MDNISSHISYNEAVKSITAMRYAIDNVPNKAQLDRMILLANNVFEPTRTGLNNRPIRVVSFFRSPNLNDIIHGAIRSQHLCNNGAAIDLDNDNMKEGPTNAEIFNYIKDNLEFDQLIWEFGDKKNPGWVHCSYNYGKNRYKLTRAIKTGGLVKYLPYIL